MKKYIEVIKDEMRILIDANSIMAVAEREADELNYASRIECENGKTYFSDTLYLDIKYELLK